jgi:hypothetical protein
MKIPAMPQPSTLSWHSRPVEGRQVDLTSQTNCGYRFDFEPGIIDRDQSASLELGKTMRAILYVLSLFAVSVAGIDAGLAQAIDLTGVWHTGSGATFFVRQVGFEIWWYGTQAPTQPRWSNVASGRLDGNVVRVQWVDVPQGTSRNSGILALRILDANHLVVSENPNNFVSEDWSR